MTGEDHGAAPDRGATSEPRSLRLFVAIEIPPSAVDAVAAAVAPIRSAFPAARWAPAENWHVTMKFLGAADPRRLDRIGERIDGVAAHAVAPRTRLSGLGCFPSAARARVLWVGLDDAPGRMAELALGLDAALSKDFKPETRPFSAHLTVARSDPPLDLTAVLDATAPSSEPFTVRELVLVRSHLRRPAPRYEALRRFPLRG